MSGVELPRPRAERKPLSEEVRDAIRRLGVGDCVDVEAVEAQRARSYAVSMWGKVVRRKQPSGMVRIWRADVTAQENSVNGNGGAQ